MITTQLISNLGTIARSEHENSYKRLNNELIFYWLVNFL
jgi:hypothetical protein